MFKYEDPFHGAGEGEKKKGYVCVTLSVYPHSTPLCASLQRQKGNALLREYWLRCLCIMGEKKCVVLIPSEVLHIVLAPGPP